jgi:CheY-like chemotaxis protein
MVAMNRKKILIVDDDKFLLDMYAIKFKEAGCEVALAVSGADALKQIDDGFVPNAVLVDIVMPGMGGLELLKEFRKRPALEKVALIVLSNQGQAGDKEEAEKIGIDGYIVKANSIPSEVLDTVSAIMSKK